MTKQERRDKLTELLKKYGIEKYQVTVTEAGRSQYGKLEKLYVDRMIHQPTEFNKIGYFPIKLKELAGGY